MLWQRTTRFYKHRQFSLRMLILPGTERSGNGAYQSLEFACGERRISGSEQVGVWIEAMVAHVLQNQ